MVGKIEPRARYGAPNRWNPTPRAVRAEMTCCEYWIWFERCVNGCGLSQQIAPTALQFAGWCNLNRLEQSPAAPVARAIANCARDYHLPFVVKELYQANQPQHHQGNCVVVQPMHPPHFQYLHSAHICVRCNRNVTDVDYQSSEQSVSWFRL